MLVMREVFALRRQLPLLSVAEDPKTDNLGFDIPTT